MPPVLAGRIIRWVERYQALFDHVHVVLHDDIKTDVAQVYRDVPNFLVDPAFQPDFSVVNPNTRAKSQAMRKIIQGLWFGPWRHVVPGPARRLGRKGFERLQAMNTETAARPPSIRTGCGGDGELRGGCGPTR